MEFLSIRLGTGDTGKARDFYDAVFSALGYSGLEVPMNETSVLYRFPSGLNFVIAEPPNGCTASAGNGTVIGLWAEDADAVDRWHAAGLENGGTCDGEPRKRQELGGRYCAFLFDPDGHRVCVHAKD